MAKQKILSPKGTAVYPWLNNPDTRSFNGQPSRPAYKVSLRLTGEAIGQLQASIDPLVEESYQLALEEAKPADRKKVHRAYPYSEEVDSMGNETGAMLFKFKQNAELRAKDGSIIKMKVPLFDSKLNTVSEMVYGGSEIKTAFTTRPYYLALTKAAGISCDLSAVQVLTLVSGNGQTGTSFGFGSEEGFESVAEVESPQTFEEAFEDEDEEF
jgi:hypothetical protein